MDKSGIIIRKTLRFLESMQFGLFLVVLLGIGSIIGSTISEEDFYRSWWFVAILSLLFINLLFCSVKRLRFIIISNTVPVLKARQMGILMVHLSLLLIIAGVVVSIYGGKTGFVSLSQGETANLGDVLGKRQKNLSLNLQKFTIDYNEDGSPSQFTSRVTLYDQERLAVDKQISVNHPLSYQGLKIYQYSYSWLVEQEVSGPAGSKTSSAVMEGELVHIPGSEFQVKVYRYIPNYDPAWGMTSKGLRPDNPRVVFSVYKGQQRLGIGIAKLGEQIKISDDVTLVFTGVRPVSTLMVKIDPGRSVVLAGGLLLVFGVILVLGCALRARSREEGI